jgi:aerobic carbon-monoxide dehydrogenase medium subunit
MRPAPFEYQAPESVAEATEMLSSGDRPVKVLAGGQTLVPQMIKRAVCPRLLIDVKRIAALRTLDVDPEGSTSLGPLVSHEQLMHDDAVRTHWPVLARASSYVSNPVVRRRGTVGGSVGWGDGRSEIAAALVACDASAVVTSSARGARELAVAQLTGKGPDGLREDELITDILLGPAGGRQTCGVAEWSPRRWDPPLAGAACRLTWGEGDMHPLYARVVVFGELSSAHRLEGVEEALGRSADPTAVREAIRVDAELATRELAVTRDRAHLAAALAETTSRAVEMAHAVEGR